MAIHERKGYKISATVDAKYAPLILRGRPLHEQTPKSEFRLHRESGATNVDLWVDGTIYPRSPMDNRHPRFQTVSDFLEFVAQGKRGLLGYIESFQGGDSLISFQLAEAQRQITALREQTQQLFSISEERNNLLHFSRAEASARQGVEEQNRLLIIETENLRSECSILQSNRSVLEASLSNKLQCLQGQEDDQLDREVDSWIEIETLKEEHIKKVQDLSLDLKRTRATLRRRELRLQKIVKNPYGYRSSARARKDLRDLAPKGGHTKRMLRLARNILTTRTSGEIQSQNAKHGTRQRLCGSREIQVENAQMLTSLLTKQELTSMCEFQKFSSVRIGLANHYLDKIGESIGPDKILEVMDKNGITQNAWGGIYKMYQKAARTSGRGLRITLPNPHQVSLRRTALNLKLTDYVGDYYSITNLLEVPAPMRSKSKDPTMVRLNEFNSLFVDLEQVQKTMVEFYGVTLQELEGRPLIWVIKLDEAEIIHSQKMERVSVTLMNRALDNRIALDSKEYFSVQSEREIWPIASFQIPRENHEILSWVFQQTHIPALIQAQEDGQLLDVPGIGSFKCEWHLAADLKTVKCMYGLKMGANSKHSCIYCLQERQKAVVTTTAQAVIAMSSRKFHWEGGLFSDKIQAQPLIGAACMDRWKPILPIPLDRVHICTLHGFNRIIEKLIHMHFMHIWTIRDKMLQKNAIEEMQRVVSSTGAHGGNVIIFKDAELSGKSNSVPNKPSFSGAHAMKLFGTNSSEKNAPKLYIEVVNAEKNFMKNGQCKRDKIDMWHAFDALRPYLSGLRLEEGQNARDFQLKAEEFGQRYISCYGEHHITQYMHILIRHAPYFVERYGSLAVWSCQGMENSHHAAKTAYQRHTQHSGGKVKKSPLIQTFQHWYRIIAHRFRNKETIVNAIECDTLRGEEAIQARRDASLRSSAAAHTAQWRSKCTRVGSRWVPNINEPFKDPQ